MQTVRAFVGHSFTEEDEPTVRAFTNYLTTLKDAIPGFSWDHAVRPEPALVDEKVLALIRDKNVFIGICTKKERVIADSALSRWFLKTKRLFADEDQFEWKTSDWIIQEIGLAIGRGLKIILLIEHGLRRPGSLQGNIEYIDFDRSSPEGAFDKLAGMLAAVRGTAASMAEGEARPVQSLLEAVADPAQKAHDSSLEPKGGWELDDYKTALGEAVLRGDDAVVRRIEAAFSSSPVGKNAENRRNFEGWKEYALLHGGKGGNFSRLRELAAEATGNTGHELLHYLGLSYSFIGEYAEAGASFERAAGLPCSPGNQSSYLLLAAKQYHKAGDKAALDRVQQRMRELVHREPDVLAVVLEGEAGLAKESGDDDAFFGMNEAALQLRPDDASLRFSLAYRYSQLGRDGLSYFH